MSAKEQTGTAAAGGAQSAALSKKSVSSPIFDEFLVYLNQR